MKGLEPLEPVNRIDYRAPLFPRYIIKILLSEFNRFNRFNRFKRFREERRGRG